MLVIALLLTFTPDPFTFTRAVAQCDQLHALQEAQLKQWRKQVAACPDDREIITPEDALTLTCTVFGDEAWGLVPERLSLRANRCLELEAPEAEPGMSNGSMRGSFRVVHIAGGEVVARSEPRPFHAERWGGRVCEAGPSPALTAERPRLLPIDSDIERGLMVVATDRSDADAWWTTASTFGPDLGNGPELTFVRDSDAEHKPRERLMSCVFDVCAEVALRTTSEGLEVVTTPSALAKIAVSCADGRDNDARFRDVGCAWFAGRSTDTLFRDVERYCARPRCDEALAEPACQNEPACNRVAAVAALLKQPPPRVVAPGQP